MSGISKKYKKFHPLSSISWVSPEFRTGQYRDDDSRKGTLTLKYTESSF